VKVGLAVGAFKLSSVCVAPDTGLPASVVLSTLLRPTIVLVIPETEVAFVKDTAPVKLGLSLDAFKLSSVCVALDTGLLASVVLSTLLRPTIALESPVTEVAFVKDTAPVKLGLASGALSLSAV